MGPPLEPWQIDVDHYVALWKELADELAEDLWRVRGAAWAGPEPQPGSSAASIQQTPQPKLVTLRGTTDIFADNGP